LAGGPGVVWLMGKAGRCVEGSRVGDGMGRLGTRIWIGGTPGQLVHGHRRFVDSVRRR